MFISPYEDFPAWMCDWEDGPKSFGNVFTAHYDGQPSCLRPAKGVADPSLISQAATRSQQAKKKAGKTGLVVGTLYWLKRQDLKNARRAISIDPNPVHTRDYLDRIKKASI